MKTLSITISLLLGVFTFSFFGFNNHNDDRIEVKSINTEGMVDNIANVNFIKIKKGKMSYKVVNKNHENYDFYINANYFDTRDVPIGEVKINGKNITRKKKGGGFFTTDGKTPKFYFNNRSENVKFSSQTHTPVIKKGVVNTRFFNQSWAKKKLARLIIGENKSGDIIVIHTMNHIGLSVKDITNIAKNVGMYNALMFDGGASVDVRIKNGDYEYSYQEVNQVTRLFYNPPKPKVYIVGTFN